MLRGINIGIAHHKLFEHIILNCAGELFGHNPLLFGGDDVERQNWQNSAIHGHGDAHFIQRDLIEQGAHVVNAIDCHAGHADITNHPFMVAVIAAMGG